METKLFSHSALLVLVFAVTVIICDRINIQVSESGQDNSSCVLQEKNACKTLAYYVLSKMSNSDFYSSDMSQIVINVTYNQTIQNVLEFTFPPVRSIIKVGVVGCNNAFINFENSRSFIRVSPTVNSVSLRDIFLYWSWKGLGFAWVSQYGIDDQMPYIKMSRMYFLEVIDCKLESVSLDFEFAIATLLTNNVFGNSAYCPTVNLSMDFTFFILSPPPNPVTVKIENNTFENCQHHSLNSIVNFVRNISHSRLIMLKNSSILIMNNLFVNLKSCTSSSTSAISVVGSPAGILIQRNKFVDNTMCFIFMEISIEYKALIGDPCTWCIMQENVFYNNNFILTEKQPPGILVSINSFLKTSKCDFASPFNFFSFKIYLRTIQILA